MSDLGSDDAGRFYRAAFEEAVIQRDEKQVELERLRWIMSRKIDEDSNPNGPQTLLDTYDETNPAWIDAMRFGTYGPMPPRVLARPMTRED